MSTNFILQANARDDLGKGASRRLRREQNSIPAIVYGAGKPAESIKLRHDDVLHALEHEVFTSSIIELKIDKKSQDVLLKAVQRHPYKPKILHVDFQRVKANVAMKVSVPLHFLGEDVAPGVKEGGVVSHIVTEVEVLCLPKDLPEYLEIDVSNLELEAALNLSDIKPIPNVEITALQAEEPNDLLVVNIHKAKVVEESEELEATDEAGSDSAEDTSSGADSSSDSDQAADSAENSGGDE